MFARFIFVIDCVNIKETRRDKFGRKIFRFVADETNFFMPSREKILATQIATVGFQPRRRLAEKFFREVVRQNSASMFAQNFITLFCFRQSARVMKEI